MWYAAILIVGLAEYPDALPDALPDAAPPVVAKQPAPIVNDPLRILRYEQRCVNGVCQLVPVFATENIDEAARKLQDWRDLPAEEVKRLEAIVNGPAVKRAIRQEWSIGTCAMACVAGGSQLYDVFEDGAVKLAAKQPATAPDEGIHGGRRWLGRRR